MTSAPEAPQATPGLAKALLPIFLIVLVDILGLTIVLPLLPFYAQKYGATAWMATSLTSVFAFCQLVSGPILGSLSDQYGRKPVLIFSQIGTLIGFLILALAETLPLIFLSRVIDGATAGNLSIAQAYISDVTAPKDRAKSFAVIGIAFGLGFLVGPAVSGYLSQFGYHTPIFAAAGLSFLSILATQFLLPAVPKREAPLSDINPGPGGKRLSVFNWGAYLPYFQRKELGVLLQQFFLFAFSFSLFTSCFALFAERRFTWEGAPFGPREVGYVFAFTGLLGIFIQGGMLSRLVKRWGEEKVTWVGFGCAALGYMGLAASWDVPTLLAVSTIATFGHGVLRPALTSLISRRAAPHEQGVVLGLTQSLNSVATILSPILGGFFIQHDFLSGWALLTGLICLGGYLLRWKSARITDELHPKASA
jgi:DHA1 family tetracycline resistance protein-like MFS transporter